MQLSLPLNEPAPPSDFDDILRIMQDAFKIGALGKGMARHGRAVTPWARHPIMEIQRMLGNAGFTLGQAMKKCQEAGRFTVPQQSINELYGAIIYVVAAIKFYEEVRDKELCLNKSTPTT